MRFLKTLILQVMHQICLIAKNWYNGVTSLSGFYTEHIIIIVWVHYRNQLPYDKDMV
jgi:hypothetical protein